MKKLILTLWIAACSMMTAQAQIVVDTLLNKVSSEPFSFAVQVPDGNYRVTVTLGNKKKAGQTVVRAESRRHYFDAISTKKGKYETVSFVVNKKTARIDAKTNVRLKPRELTYKNWDDSLNLSFCGPMPAVQRIKIEPVKDVTTVFLCSRSPIVKRSARYSI